MKVAAMRIPQMGKNIEFCGNLGILGNETNDDLAMSEKQVAEKGEQTSPMEEAETSAEDNENLTKPARRITEEEKAKILDEQKCSMEGNASSSADKANLTIAARRMTEEEKAERLGEQISPMEAMQGAQSGRMQVQEPSKIIFTRPANVGSTKGTVLAIDDITFSEDGDTYAHECGEDIKLFDGTYYIVSVQEFLEEIHNRDGSLKFIEKRYQYAVNLILKGQNFHTIVDLNGLFKGAFIKEASGGKAILYPGKAKKYYEIFVKEKLNVENYPVITLYEKGGWKKFTDGSLRYITSRGMIGSAELSIKVDSTDWFGVKNQEFDESFMARYFLQMRDVLSGSEGIVLLQYYGLIGILKSLLKAYDIDPDFSLMVRGPSNVGKSTIALLLYKIMNRHILRNADADFTATVKALDEMKAVNPDTVFLVDDITKKNKKKAGEKLEFLLRQYGNDHASSVSQIYAKQHGVKAFSPVLNQLAVTAEVMPDLSSSARSRMLDVEIKAGESNFRAITREQQQSWMLAQFYFSFIRFVTVNQWSLLPHCRDKFMEIRNMDMLQCKMKRYNSTFAVFMIIADIFKQYLLASGEFAAGEVETIIANDLEAIKAVILENDRECSKLAEIENVTDAIDEMIAEAVLSEEQKQSLGTGSKTVIVHKGFYVIRSKDMLELVNSYIHKEGVSFSLTSSKLGEMLQERELIEITVEGGQLRRTKKFTHQGVEYGRCYFIKCDKVNALATSAV